MEIADLIESLKGYWESKNQQTNWFKNLFNPKTGNILVKECLQDMPGPVKSHFLNLTNKVYLELEELTIKSVWNTTKKTPNGIIVKSSDLKSEKEMTWDKFTAEYYRALRNTNHGYFTDINRDTRSSRYLSLVTGDTPDSMPYLGLLWTISLLANPEKMISWKRKSTGTCEKVF